MNRDARLDEFDKDEWWDVCRQLKPDLTRLEYDAMWTEFQRRKQLRKAN